MKVLCMILLCVRSWIKVEMTLSSPSSCIILLLTLSKYLNIIALNLLHQLNKSNYLLALGLFNAHEYVLHRCLCSSFVFDQYFLCFCNFHMSLWFYMQLSIAFYFFPRTEYFCHSFNSNPMHLKLIKINMIRLHMSIIWQRLILISSWTKPNFDTMLHLIYPLLWC